MSRKRIFGRLAGVCLTALATCSLSAAVNGTWNWFTEGYTNGLSPEAVADWNDSANWVNGVVPDGNSSATAFLVPSDRTTSMASFPARWVKVPDAGITLGYLSTRQAAKIYILGGPISFATTSSYAAGYAALRDEVQNSGTCPVWLYSALTFPDQFANNTGTLVNRVNICAPVTCSYPARVQISSDYRHYMNRYATSMSEQIVDEGLTGRYSPGSGSVRLYARMSAPEQTGTWITESGSPYLRRAGGTHDLTPGCSVTGDGIPAGMFLKRIFADDLIEISDAATASSGAGGAELVFGAFNPVTLQHVESLACQGADLAQVTFNFTKFRAHDEFRVVVTNLLSMGNYNHKIVFDTDTSAANCFATNKTFYPGTVVLHNTPNHYRTTLVLNEAHVEFAGTNGTASGGINLLNVNGNARIAVSNGVEATVHRLVAWGGSLVKEGAGTLMVNSTNATHHALSVEGGTFVFNATYHDGSATLDSLAVADGATFRLVAGSTLKVLAAPTLASGARIVIEEGARLILPGSYVPPSGVTFDGAGTLISACSAGGLNGGPIRATPPVGTVVGNPAFWVTAESLTNAVPSGMLVAENGTNFVTRLNDCRGDADQGYHFCTNVYNRPWLVTSGSVPYIQFKTGTSGGSESENNYGLAWDVPLTNIRVVFAVLSSPSSGMGCLLGATKRLYPCDYLRGSTSSGSNLFYWNANGNCSSPDVYNAPIYRNGIEIKYNSNYNGCSDTTVVEVDSLADTSADAFSICQSVKWGKRWDLCGGRLVEYIIYTNVLTYAERLQVSDYLMRKWRGESSPHNFADQRQRVSVVTFPQGDATYGIDVASGEAVTALRVEAGGVLGKTGGGTLHLMDYSDPTGTLCVEEGTVVVQSVDPTALALPSGAYLHLDASADSTLTKTTSGGITRVTSWSDPDGGLTATLRASSSTNAPRFVENVLNGLPVLDFGAAQGSQSQGAKNDPTMRFTISRNIRTVFSVLGSKGGGNTILGGTAGRNDTLATRTSNNTAIGIWRDVQYHAGDPSLPLVTTSGNTSSQMSNIANPANTEFHKNGLVVNQKTEPMGGGYDLYTVKTITDHSMESDTLGGIHYAQSWGGVELGEIAYYERVLTADEVADAESHLLLKWFNRGGPYRRPAEAGALSVATGATLSLFGGAPMTVSALSGSGTVDGDVKFASGGGAVTAVVAADGTIAPLSVTGGLDVTGGGVVTLVGDVERLVAGEHVLACAASITGTAAGWTCVCANEHLRYAVRVRDGDLVVIALWPGTVILFR